MATTNELQIDDVDKWFEDYKPLPNHFDPDASWNDGENGLMFETYGEEQDYVYAYDHKYVWTYMDVDGGTAIVAGRSFVNRIGYFITEKPWATGEEYVQVDEDDDIIECTVCERISDDTDFIDFYINPDGVGFCEQCVPQDSSLTP